MLALLHNINKRYMSKKSIDVAHDIAKVLGKIEIIDKVSMQEVVMCHLPETKPLS